MIGMMVIPRRLIQSCALLSILLLSARLVADDARPALRSAVDTGEFDTTVGPQTNFFQHVNGVWLKSHPIPPDRSGWGVDTELQEQSLQDLKAIAEGLLTDSDATEDRQKIRDFYATAMDTAKLNGEGLQPLGPELTRIGGVADAADLARVLARLHSIGSGPLFSAYVDQDQKQSDHYALYLAQGGTILPEREYYLGDDPESRKIRQAYREHLQRMFILLGDSPAVAAAEAGTVLALETRLAEKQMTPVELRDPEPQYNKMTLAQLAVLAPDVDWGLYLRSIGAADVKEVIVCQPEFLKRVGELWRKVPPADWQTYLRWHLASSAAPNLSDPFVEEDFRFEQVLGGAKELKPRWKRAIETIDVLMGEALGRVYVERRFGAQEKQRINELADNLIAAYGDRIRSRQWMGAETRAKALAKLATMRRKLGYPDKWRDYSALSIRTDHYLLNCFRAAEFEFRRRLSRLGQPVDVTEWTITPPSVNACYNATTNDITFPAGILQPPFFDVQADDALNYGGIGAVIGHEMTHGFDDQGSKFDAAGNLANWWMAGDRASFHARAAKLVGQYNACIPIDAMHINGELTLGENIADLGGLCIALDAYNRSLKGKSAPVIDGLTGLQRFFISYAISWRNAYHAEQLKVMLRTDEHAPARFRVLVPLSNMPAFLDAFGVKKGDAMYRAPADRAEVW
jgi:putative endopeptidase